MKQTKTVIFLALCVLALAANAQQGARPGTTPDDTSPEQVQGTGADQGFEDVPGLIAADWDSINTSDDSAGATNGTWFQGNTDVFNAQAGPNDSYAAANFNATGGSRISLWLLVPDVGNLESATFWTRTVAGSSFPDRMQVRFSAVGGTDVGTDPDTVGDYDNLLMDINENLDVGGYPEAWTEMTVNPNSEGRLAFRYFVPDNAGPAGSQSNYIGVDTLSFVIGDEEPPPAPAVSVPTLNILGLGALVLLLAFVGVEVVRRNQGS